MVAAKVKVFLVLWTPLGHSPWTSPAGPESASTTKTISAQSCWDSGLCLAVSWVCCCEGQNVPYHCRTPWAGEWGRVFIFPMKSPPCPWSQAAGSWLP